MIQTLHVTDQGSKRTYIFPHHHFQYGYWWGQDPNRMLLLNFGLHLVVVDKFWGDQVICFFSKPSQEDWDEMPFKNKEGKECMEVQGSIREVVAV